jgi:hypothetical protein
MPGQLSNYLKNFNKVIDYVSPYVSAVGDLLSSLNTPRNVFINLNKLDDPNATQKDKAVDVAKSVAAIAGLVPNPVIGPAANLVDTASYLTDLQEGRRDAPPKPADINSRTSPIGDGVNKIINSTPLRNFVSNFRIWRWDILIELFIFSIYNKTYSREILNSIPI